MDNFILENEKKFLGKTKLILIPSFKRYNKLPRNQN